jgi:hypothetical protein
MKWHFEDMDFFECTECTAKMNMVGGSNVGLYVPDVVILLQQNVKSSEFCSQRTIDKHATALGWP